MPYCVYVLQSKITGRYYVGHSEHVEKRLIQHNNDENKSTKHGRPWEKIYVETMGTRSEAIQKEDQIKKRGIERYLRGVAQPG